MTTARVTYSHLSTDVDMIKQCCYCWIYTPQVPIWLQHSRTFNSVNERSTIRFLSNSWAAC